MIYTCICDKIDAVFDRILPQERRDADGNLIVWENLDICIMKGTPATDKDQYTVIGSRSNWFPFVPWWPRRLTEGPDKGKCVVFERILVREMHWTAQYYDESEQEARIQYKLEKDDDNG